MYAAYHGRGRCTPQRLRAIAASVSFAATVAGAGVAGFGWWYVRDATKHLGPLQKAAHLQSPVIFGSFGLTVAVNGGALVAAFWKHGQVCLVEAIKVLIWVTYSSQLLLTLIFLLTSSFMLFLKGICEVGGFTITEAQSLFSKLAGTDLLGEWLADVEVQQYCDNSSKAGEHVYFLFLGCVITSWSQALMLSCLTAAKAQARLHNIIKSSTPLAMGMDEQGSDDDEEYKDSSLPVVSSTKSQAIIKEAMRQHKLNQLNADNKAQKLENRSGDENSNESTRDIYKELGRRAEAKKKLTKSNTIESMSSFKTDKTGGNGSPRSSKSSKTSTEDDPPSNKRQVPQLDARKANVAESSGQDSDSPREAPRPKRRHSEDRTKAKKPVRAKPASDPSGDVRRSRHKKREVHHDESDQEKDKSSRKEHGSHRPHKSRHDVTRAKLASIRALDGGRMDKGTRRSHRADK